MSRVIDILDQADPRIAAYRHVREADLVGRDGGFIVEGEVVLRTCLRAGLHPLQSVLLAQKRVAGLADVLTALPAATQIYSAPQAIMDEIVGFHIHRGVLAAGRRAGAGAAANLLDRCGPRALVVAVFGVGNHDNIGGIFRNAAAFGADAVLLGTDCCDPLYRKAIRVSVGATLTVPFARFEVGADPVAVLTGRGFEAIALSPAGEIPLAALKRPPRAALLLGAEGPGLSAAILQRACVVSIPMAGSFDSLNVATACGVALYQLVFGG